MVGETDLTTLLVGLKPILQPEPYVFVSVLVLDTEVFERLNPKVLFREKEGVTLVLLQSVADAEGFTYETVFNCITCEIHSSLEAVGLTAAMSQALTKVGISANVIAAFYHDHIFVPQRDAHNAMAALNSLVAEYN
ncbi:ACT domain-containing protein [Alteromonas gilva]|uniref:ACT domain-containing protein n=1 Tax=Alteromonas gilva TaxID=2987522 RepID=A0ABT5KZ33_9ALTE|nr:ACT domain-containing protein [Alteromonas gilva]MDC8829907.1 ACT domain-containing protein [Alteromonas gilva]